MKSTLRLKIYPYGGGSAIAFSKAACFAQPEDVDRGRRLSPQRPMEVFLKSDSWRLVPERTHMLPQRKALTICRGSQCHAFEAFPETRGAQEETLKISRRPYKNIGAEGGVI